MKSDRDHVELLVESTWREYARPRFAVGEIREVQARASFELMTEMLYWELRCKARKAGQSLDFSVDSLRLLILRALDHACVYCNFFFGLDTWAVALRVPPANNTAACYRFANLVVS